MDKVIKISSQQGYAGTWLNTGTAPSSLNLLDFTIDRGLNIDMSRSYISLNSQINNTTNAQPINARWKFQSDGANDANVPTAALIKNVTLRNDKGLVESVRRVDTLACSLFGLTNSAEDRKNDLNTFSKFVDGRGVGNYTSVQLDCITDNTAPNGSDVNPLHNSKSISRDIKIPLKDVLGCCGAERYSTDNMGQTRIHCEMNADLLSSEHLGGAEDTSNMFDGATKYGKMTDETVADGADFGTEHISEGAYGDYQYVCPFYVGQQVIINFSTTPSAGGATTPRGPITTTIVSMKYQTNNEKPSTGADPNTNFAKMIFQVANNIFNNATGVEQVVSAILMKADTTLALQNVISRAELCLYTIPDDGNMPTSLTFPTYTTEEDNGTGLTSFNRQYMLEPEADAILVALCNDNVILPARAIKSYRYAIDQDEQTGNRDIPVCSNNLLGSPLQYDRLQRCLDSQIAVGFRNAQLRFYNSAEAAQTAVYGSPIAVIAETCEESKDSKMLNLNIESDQAIQKMVIYKHMYKTI
ncbi:MAG: hypothetical protein ACR2M6_03725 [Vampirovibrionia bacterium]